MNFSNLSAFKTISVDSFNSDFGYGDTITGSYPLFTGIEKHRYAEDADRPLISSLQNILNNNYTKYSPHYAYTSSLGDKSTQEIGILSIPSSYYGSSIKKTSIDLKFYVTGALFGRLQDIRGNGELVQTGPTGSIGSGSVAGVVLYNEGIMLLTGSWDLSNGSFTEPYVPCSAATIPSWVYFANTGSTGASENLPSSSFGIYFEGVNYINTMTMFCRAKRGEINYSQNPTWLEYGQNRIPVSGSRNYKEPSSLNIKNISKSNWAYPSASFERTVFVDRIKIYDEDRNIIMIAKLATPIRKREQDSICYKLIFDH